MDSKDVKYIRAELDDLLASNEDAIMLIGSSDWGSNVLPIWIGMMEAFSIKKALGEAQFPRPLTQDLVMEIIEALSGSVEKVTIDALLGHTYTATIYLKDRNGKIHYIDARPSDAVAIALRADAPIFVASHLYQYTKPKDAIITELDASNIDIDMEE